ncbi:unnamed protein product [Amaranthus hypochondriacus]
MDAEQKLSDTTKDNVKVSFCEECNSKESKYKCPACSRRTCSLPCVNAHKKTTGCTGKRNYTQIISKSQFNDSTLLSDFHLLEDVKRLAESAQRTRVKLCGSDPHFRLPFHLKALQSCATSKGTNLLFLPYGMTKREKNQTRYNQRKKFILWTIEWRFHLTDVVLLEHGVHENSTLRSVIDKHLQPSPWRNKLRRFCKDPLDKVKFFIRENDKGNKAPYRELDLDAPLYHLLGGLVILEYPVIHVFLESDKYDFEVVKDVRPLPRMQDCKKADRDDTASPVGVRLKEEEIIEDEGGSEPRIIDLLNSPRVDAYMPNSVSGESAEDFPFSFQDRVEMLDANIDNKFDQELIDSYSSLMKINTDVYFADLDELEEGEIPPNSY